MTRQLTALLVTLAARTALAATSGYFEGWNTSGNTAGWTGNTIDSSVAQQSSGGNPGGFLRSSRSGPGLDIGSLTGLPAATGDFSGSQWTAAFDVDLISGQFTDTWLRFKYSSDSFNGWTYHFGTSPTGVWTGHSVTFDPAWSDAEATAAGWATDLPNGSGSVSFSQTMSDVFTTEVRISGTGALTAGIDNFGLVAVPEPSTYALLATGLAIIGIMRGYRGRSRSLTVKTV